MRNKVVMAYVTVKRGWMRGRFSKDRVRFRLMLGIGLGLRVRLRFRNVISAFLLILSRFNDLEKEVPS
jgi:hypothetical protein